MSSEQCGGEFLFRLLLISIDVFEPVIQMYSFRGLNNSTLRIVSVVPLSFTKYCAEDQKHQTIIDLSPTHKLDTN